MTWSSFFIDSRLGPEAAPSAESGMVVLSWGDVSEPVLARPAAPRASLGLFVRDGLVWGEFAGEGTRRLCWCIVGVPGVGSGCRMEAPSAADAGRFGFCLVQQSPTWDESKTTGPSSSRGGTERSRPAAGFPLRGKLSRPANFCVHCWSSRRHAVSGA